MLKRFFLWPALGVSMGLSVHAQPSTDLGRVDVTSGRDNDLQQRRESTASKIVIGREEIERQGDATLGEILKRQPGITLDGVPGRGGAIRMRGLSQGYTQILLDGQRVPPGFSIDALTPEMVERIEIYRAPTAETGAQAIAGTINVITREGRRGMPAELKVGAAFQGAYSGPTASLVRYHDSERWSANYTLSANRWSGPDHSETDLIHQEPGNTFTRRRVSDGHYERQGVNASARLQFKGLPGESFTLMPFIASSRGISASTLSASLNQGSGEAASYNDNRFIISRLNGQWRRKLSNDSNMEWKFNVGGWNSVNRFNQGSMAAANLAGLDEATQTQDRSFNLSGKYTHVLGGGHQWVSGAESETGRRQQSALTSYANGTGDFSAQTQRYALFTQDEWQFTPHWATHWGVRYEQLTTQGHNGVSDMRNTNQVFTPLLHALYRPNPESRDQLRISLTRSFRTPSMPSLMSRRVSSRDANSPTSPDTMGNINLKPEVATGLDVTTERYLPQGGVLSATVFHRRIQDVIRNVVSYDGTRWVSMPQNISAATTQGVELEAKFRLNQWIANAPAVETRSNVSFYRSRVDSVPGPDNRLDQQAKMTANLGADYRLRSMPLTIGGNVNFNPGYDTRTSEYQLLTVSQKRVIDVYGLWRVDPQTAWRLSVSNWSPRNAVNTSQFSNGSLTETATTQNRSWTTVQLMLEKKL